MVKSKTGESLAFAAPELVSELNYTVVYFQGFEAQSHRFRRIAEKMQIDAGEFGGVAAQDRAC